MKVALVGVGQAGGKVVQAIVDRDRRAGFGAVRGALAINTASSDLGPLDVPTMLVGQDRVNGQGVGGDNQLGSQILREDASEVTEAVDRHVAADTEAVVVVAGLGGGTGSGGAPMVAAHLKRVYDLPVYGLGVLPGDDEGAMYQVNAGQSLKTMVREADSLLLVDNDAWHTEGESLEEGYDAINEAIARRVGLLFAAGEPVDGVGESVVDSSEVINTLREGGVSAIGYAAAEASPDAAENIDTVTSLVRQALLSDISLPGTTTADAALVVIAGNPAAIPRKGVERARRWLEEETGSLQVRGGDVPMESDHVAALVLLAGVSGGEAVEAFMNRARAAKTRAEAQADDRADPVESFRSEELDDLI